MIVDIREKRLLWASGALRKKVAECERLARDVKIRMVFEELRLRSEKYNEIVRILSQRFDASPSTVKRAIRRLAPAAERAASRGPRRPPAYPPRPPNRR
jgi:hypothetical protein